MGHWLNAGECVSLSEQADVEIYDVVDNTGRRRDVSCRQDLAGVPLPIPDGERLAIVSFGAKVVEQGRRVHPAGQHHHGLHGTLQYL
jgi:hypothetical protein